MFTSFFLLIGQDTRWREPPSEGVYLQVPQSFSLIQLSSSLVPCLETAEETVE
jgi:hypothetical protein